MMVYYNTVKFQFGRVGLIWQGKNDSLEILQILLPHSDIIRFIKSRYPGAIPSTNSIIKKLTRDMLKNRWQNISLRLFAQSQMSRFQLRVLYATRRIPRGRVTTYKKLALKIGAKNGMRAVGQALAKTLSLLSSPAIG